MASESESDTSRTVVQTYVPTYQREQWDAHADELGMSRSEFVKTMVQAGRRKFGGQLEEPSEQSTDRDLESEVIELLSESGAADWDSLLAGVTDDIETRLDETLNELQEADRIRYSGREGGYVLTEGADE